MPPANARSRMAVDVFSSHCKPNVIVPRQSLETVRPVRPRRMWRMGLRGTTPSPFRPSRGMLPAISGQEATMELAGQVAIVTGGGRGIGRATALELARLGADIVVAELDRGNADKTAAAVKDLGRRALVIATDVTKRAELATMAERTRTELGRIDILVNNAGIYRAAATLDVTEEHWDAIMTINAKAVFFATQAVLPTMIAQKRGNIISLASMAGKVVSMTKSLALAHAADGIRANCVCPGFVETDMWNMVARDQGALLGMSPEEFTSQREKTVPLGRMERPEDVANVIGFLASSKSGYITRQALSVDGGLVMHG